MHQDRGARRRARHKAMPATTVVQKGSDKGAATRAGKGQPRLDCGCQRGDAKENDAKMAEERKNQRGERDVTLLVSKGIAPYLDRVFMISSAATSLCTLVLLPSHLLLYLLVQRTRRDTMQQASS